MCFFASAPQFRIAVGVGANLWLALQREIPLNRRRFRCPLPFGPGWAKCLWIPMPRLRRIGSWMGFHKPLWNPVVVLVHDVRMRYVTMIKLLARPEQPGASRPCRFDAQYGSVFGANNTEFSSSS